MGQAELFQDDGGAGTPLAERMRPVAIEDMLGQETLLGEGSLLRDLIENDRVPSMILWGPPGCGKTTLARVIANRTGMHFSSFSAVLSGVKEVRAVIAEAQHLRVVESTGTILFVDEIHRFNKGQQDAFLPHVEDGTVVLIGATTENPSFEINSALLSRCQVFTLEALPHEALASLVGRAMERAEELGLPADVKFTPDGIDQLIATSHGDARTILNRLEAILSRESACETPRGELDGGAVAEALGDGTLRYDKSGEIHFDVMSAFHKSMRGGDPQASLYWLARMLESGEDPLWVARRIVRFASEDIGLADSGALQVALAARDSYQFLGRPEGLLALAQAAVYMATAPKSNAVYVAYGEVVDDLQAGRVEEVPRHIRNAPTKLMKQLGYGKGYKYPHDFDGAVADQDYLPDSLKGRRYYNPSPFGEEKEIARRMEYWDTLKGQLGDDES